MSFKDFFKFTKWKIIAFLVLYVPIFLESFYDFRMWGISELVAIFYVPVIILSLVMFPMSFYSGSSGIFPKLNILGDIAINIMAIIYMYFLVCAVFWIIGKFRRKKTV